MLYPCGLQRSQDHEVPLVGPDQTGLQDLEVPVEAPGRPDPSDQEDQEVPEDRTGSEVSTIQPTFCY